MYYKIGTTKMVEITGKFEHVSFSPEFEDFLRAAGSPEEFIEAVLASKPSVVIDEAGVDKFTFSINFGDRGKSTTFMLGEVYDEHKHDGTVAKSVTWRDGNSLITETTDSDGRTLIKVSEFTTDGFNMTVSDENSGKKATIFFERSAYC